jgi:vesicle coat complex subunit
MMITNTIQRDLQGNSNQQVLALALATIANIATSEMCRDLYKDVITLLTHSSSFIRKKA